MPYNTGRQKLLEVGRRPLTFCQIYFLPCDTEMSYSKSRDVATSCLLGLARITSAVLGISVITCGREWIGI